MTRKIVKPPATPKPRRPAAVRQRPAEPAQSAPAKLPREAPPEAQEAMRRMVYELQVHQVELEAQNEELRHTQSELAFSRDRFNDLYDFVPVGYVALDQQGMICEANLTLVHLLRIERLRILGSLFSRYVRRESQAILQEFLKSAHEQGLAQRCEVNLRRGDEATFPAQLEITCGKDLTGAIVYRIAILDITERRLAEDRLKASVREKEVLLRELHHRVKNNLQIISSLVSLQADTLADNNVKALFAEVRARVRAMALVHERLYAAENLAALDFREYTNSLLDYLFRSYGSASNIRLKIAVQQIALPIGPAVYCGLILNELVSNVLKHAFPAGRSGELEVGFERDAISAGLCLRVRDNGVGLPADIDWRNTRSLGLRLVQMLTTQLSGTVEVKGHLGTEFRVKFAIQGEMLAL